MDTFYNDLLSLFVNGNHRFRINFVNRTLTIDRKKVDIPDNAFSDLTISEVISDLLHLFDGYYHSIPSERSNRRKRRYFVCLPESKLTDNDFEVGLLREQAQFALELYVLLNIVNGKLQQLPFKSEKNFFWQPSENHPLIIYREWIFKSE